MIGFSFSSPLQWRHNERDCVSNYQSLECFLNRLFRRRSKKTSKLRVTVVCEGNSPVTSEFPAQGSSNAETFSIWWIHHAKLQLRQHQNIHLQWGKHEMFKQKSGKVKKFCDETRTDRILYWTILCILRCVHHQTFGICNFTAHVIPRVIDKVAQISRNNIIYIRGYIALWYMWPFLLTWFNFIPSMDK